MTKIEVINTIYNLPIIRDLFNFINEYKVHFPIDVVAHFIIGAIISLILFKFISLKKTFFIVLFIAIAKEYGDFIRNNESILFFEQGKDIFFTVLPLIFLYLYQLKRSKSKKTNSFIDK